ncbi:MAG: hypothetical protein ACR2G4_06920 [Pyrinomonadaceae bacterium]
MVTSKRAALGEDEPQFFRKGITIASLIVVKFYAVRGRAPSASGQKRAVHHNGVN